MRKSATGRRLVGSVATVLLGVVAALAVTVPAASAVPQPYDADGRPVLADGRPITGVTFVAEKDAARIRQEQAAATSRGATTKAAGDLICYPNWRTIAGGGPNRAWRVNDYRWIEANGNLNADYWNMLFLPCWMADWPADAYVLLANRNGMIITYQSVTLQASRFPQYVVDGFIDNTRLFVCRYDGWWDILRGEMGPHPYIERRGDSVDAWQPGPWNNPKLFHVEPSIYRPDCRA